MARMCKQQWRWESQLVASHLVSFFSILEVRCLAVSSIFKVMRLLFNFVCLIDRVISVHSSYAHDRSRTGRAGTAA